MSAYASRPWLAHYRTAADLPAATRTVLDVFEEHARTKPQAAALRYFDDSIEFGRLNQLADRFAALLAGFGIGKGDRVALSLQNNPQFAVAQLGAWKRGAIVVPLNPMFKEQELEFHLRDSGARVWLGLESLYDGARAVLERSCVEQILVTREMDAPEALVSSASGSGERIGVALDDVAYLVYTSGTTGTPKGAMLLHRNIAYNAEVFRTWMRIGPDDAILGLAPLFHVTGLVAQLALAAWAGIPLILFHRFDVAEALRLGRRWRATMSLAAITAYIALLNSAPEDETSFLEKCYSGGAPVAPGFVEQFERRFGSYIHNIYGLTETASPSHATPFGARAPVDPASGALAIGVPIPGCEARIVTLDDPDREAPPGEAGELVMRGPMIFGGYWNRPEESARAFHDGYFRTGDVAIMDEHGWFYLVDRKKDMIIASGFKVWPREVEDLLYRHPAVKEAAVVGVPDSYRGETVKAFVALKDGCASVEAAELVRFCRDRLAAYKCPREVEFVPEIPKTATGKFLRRALRDRAE